MEPYIRDEDFTLYVGDAIDVLRQMPDESVHMVCTSPPYWGLRDYGTGSWDGGDDGCDHKRVERVMHQGRQGNATGTPPGSGRMGDEYFKDVCGKCGARRVDHQLGLEPTPEEYVTSMVAVFREVRRVLRRDGTCWLNIGDSYASDPNKGGSSTPNGRNNRGEQYGRANKTPATRTGAGMPTMILKPKDLVGIPWRLAFALQADGWYLRSDIIWSKPAPMPESVRDRPTKSHEYVFLLTKSARYYFDQEAVREPHAYDGRRKTTVQGQDGSLQHRDGERWPNSGRNIRTVWTINAEPFTEWGQTVHRRDVEADAPDGGKKRTTSPDCPVHGDRPVPVATAADDGRAGGSWIRTEHTDAGHVQAQLAELVPTGPRLDPDSALGSSDSLVPAGSPTATAHNTGTHRTASRSTSGGTAGAETSSRTGDTSPSSESPEPGGSDSHGLSGTPDHTDCTCTWYVEYTDKTSHFATFPSKLVEPCILAGTSERGCCPVCGAPWERETEREEIAQRPKSSSNRGSDPSAWRAGSPQRACMAVAITETGWRPTCECTIYKDTTGTTGTYHRPPVPCTVLDPFMGSGTVAVVARRLGRKSIGVELNAVYAALAATRLQQLSLLAEPA